MKFIISRAILTTPTVPRLNPEGTVATDPLHTPRAQGLGPEAFGSGFAKGLGELGSDMFKAAQAETEKANRTRAIESRTALDQAEVDLLYDEKSGALLKRGKDAFSLEEPTLKAFDERVGEIEKGLTTPEQKEAFRLLAMQRRVDVDKQVQRHVNGELRTYADDTNKASLESTLQNVTRHFADPARVDQERLFGLAVIASEAKEKGLPPQVVKSRVEGWESLIHSSIINRRLTDDPIGAKDYFEANRDKIIPTEAAKIEHTIRPLAANQRGIDLAEEFTGRLQAGEDYTTLRSEGYEKLGKKDAAAFKVFETQLSSNHQAWKVAKTESAEKAAIPVQNLILQIEAKGGKMDPKTLLSTPEYRSLVSLGTPEATKLASAFSDKVYQEHHAEVVEHRAEVREARADARAAKADNREALSQERQSLYLAYSTDPDRLASMSDFQFGELALKMGPALGGKLLQDRKALTSPEKLAQAKIDSKTFTSLMTSLGVKDKAKQAELYTAAQDYIVAHQQEDKKVYRSDQMKQAVIGAMQMVDVNERVSPLGLDSLSYTSTSKKRRLEVKNPEAIVIPKEDFGVITTLLSKNGITDTPKNRVRLYDAILAERGAKGVK